MEITQETLPAALSLVLTKVDHLNNQIQLNNRLLRMIHSNGYYSEDDLSYLYQIKPSVLKKLVKDGKLKKHVIGLKVLYKISEVFEAYNKIEKGGKQ